MSCFSVNLSSKSPGRITSPKRRRATVHGRDATLAITLNQICKPQPSLDLALRLMREADAELFAGHHAAAERLAHRAAELRGWA